MIFICGASTETLSVPVCDNWLSSWYVVLDLLILVVGCCCLTLINISLIENASPVYIECVAFLSISIYTLINTSLVDGAGHFYIKGIDFSQRLYPHWTLLSFGSNRINKYTKLYTCSGMKVHHLPHIVASRSHRNRCKCVWLSECPYDIWVRTLHCPHLRSNPSLKQQASKSREQRSVVGAAKHNRMNTVYGGRMWQGKHLLPNRAHASKRMNSLRRLYGNSTETLRNCRILNTGCHCKHTYVLWGLI